MVQNINLGSVQAPYWEQTITLKPNERRKIEYVTDNFQLKEASVPNVLRVNFGGSMIDTRFSAGMGYKMTEPVQFVELWNDNNIDLIVDFVLGIGEIRDNRLTVSGQVATTATPRGFSAIQGGTSTASKIGFSRKFPTNALVAISCLAGELEVEISGGTNYVGPLKLPAGKSFEINVAFSGSIGIKGVSDNATYSYFIGSY